MIAKTIRASKSKLFIEEQILSTFPRKQMFDWLRNLVLEGRADSARLIADIEKRYIFEALDKVPGHGLSKEKIAAMFSKKINRVKIANSQSLENIIINDTTGADQSKRYKGTGFGIKDDGTPREVPREYTFKNKYSLSKSVWDTVNYTEEEILNCVRASIAQGRDIRSISGDLLTFMKGGPAAVKGVWGNLEPGTREYSRRLGSASMDWRAMRLYRSEKYRQMQEAAVEDGINNPACTDEFDWILLHTGDWPCDICKVNAKGNPWKANNVPPYPHPNCFCIVEPRLKDHDEFIQQLRDYVNGADTEGAHEIEEWALGNDLKEGGFNYSETFSKDMEYKEILNDDGEERQRISSEMLKRDITTNFNESAKETINYIPALHDAVIKDFPDITKVLERITYDPHFPNNNKGAKYDSSAFVISYNKLIFNNKDNLMTYINYVPNWFVSKKINGVIAHEYGHAIHKLVNKIKKGNNRIVLDSIKTILKNNGYPTWDKIGNDLYPSVSNNRVFTEVIAEAASDYLTNGQNANNVSKLIYKELLAIYKGSL